MGRLRWIFLLFLALLAIPLALLVREALATAAEERARAHRSVAQRLVDELERELTSWLESEEARPYGHYRYLYLPEGADAEAMVLSPLAEPPAEPFVRGYFQLEPDGSLTSPRWPSDPELARRENGALPGDEVRAELEALEEVVAGLWAGEASGSPWDAPRPAGQRREEILAERRDGTDTKGRHRDELAKKAITKQEHLPVPEGSFLPRGQASQAAGTTVPLDPKSQRLLAEEEAEGEAGSPEDDSALGVLDQLNRGATSRQQRASKEERSKLENYNQFLDRQASDDQTLDAGEPLAPSLETLAEAESERPEARSFSADEVAADAPVAQEALGDTTPEPAEKTTNETSEEAVEVLYEPMVGRSAPGGDLVLYRTVILAERAYRQGMVLDPERLVSWLAARALAGSELADRVEILPDTDSPNVPEGGQAFRHRFAEPFAGLSAVVVLAPLADPGARQLTRLAIVLAVAVVLAFAALYRMVAVVVSFAERRSNFVSAVSHELKTPLTAIRMHGEMLRDGMTASEEQRQRYYRILTGEAERLTRLVNNVLELSKLERRDRPMQVTVGDLGPVLREVVELLAPHAEQKGFTLRLELGNDLPAVRYDRDALVQVLFNLVDNALKYGAAGEQREIVLAARPAERGARGVELSVIDHGPGVERRHLEKIFEPFYRGENELTRRTQGTGIGLALVRGLVERMGGTVRGRNRPEGGFEVTIALGPAVRASGGI